MRTAALTPGILPNRRQRAAISAARAAGHRVIVRGAGTRKDERLDVLFTDARDGLSVPRILTRQGFWQ